jgi:hypothetical protein
MRTQRSSPDDVTLHLCQRVRGHEMLQRLAEQIINRGADIRAVRLVGEAQPQRAIEVEDRQADAVGDDAQAVLALARFELEPLDGVDVGIGGEQAPDVAARSAIRVIVDADPERVALGAGELTLEANPLPRQCCLDVGAVELIQFAALDLDDFSADDLGGGLAGPVEEGAIDEAIALAGVDIGNRHAERIQLALGKGKQCLPLRPFALRLQGRGIEAAQ